MFKVNQETTFVYLEKFSGYNFFTPIEKGVELFADYLFNLPPLHWSHYLNA